ncbi:MAG: glutamate--cysteine ligase [Gammaproteobacteria bacterium]
MTEHLVQQVPNLTTALYGPLQALEQHFLDNQIKIECWLREQLRLTPPPFYASVDLRNAGFKLAPVDTNLFPAGFNNLNPDFLPLCVQAVQTTLEDYYPGTSRILLIPESHTRNLFYFENVAVLQEILSKAGFEVRIGSLLDEFKKTQTIALPSGRKVVLEPLVRHHDQIGVAGFSPDCVLLNNDLSGGIPEILQEIQQPILPPLTLGWSTRRKSTHFQHYADVTQTFAQYLQIDPWVITPLFRKCNAVDFLAREGETCLIEQVDALFQQIRAKYAEYNISQPPFVAIKAEAGTYGMAVMMVRSADDIKHLNHKQRTNMAKTKNGQPVTQVIIQEGVYTFETWGNDQAVAEPVAYMIGRHVVGGFYRVHTKRGIDENLNSPGMHFEPLAFASACNCPHVNRIASEQANRFYAYGVIARLALIAAARELAQQTVMVNYPQEIL